jgi:hypothetical protein
MTIRAKFSGKCSRCGTRILAGDKVEWVKGQGVTCATPCEQAERTEPTGDEARVVAYLKGLDKPNEFQASLLAQFERKGYLSEKQTAAVLRKMDTTTAQPGQTKTLVPDGRYAVELAGEWQLFRVWRGTRDPNVQHLYSVRGTERGERVFGALEAAAVQAIAADPGKAAREFGHRTGSCSRCGTELEVNLSRKIGVGPTCLKHWYGDEAKTILADARETLRAAGIDPLAHNDNVAVAA